VGQEEEDIMGRGVATLVTLAFSASEADQQQAAGMIANYLLRREYLMPLIDGGAVARRAPASAHVHTGV
jgi:hypothetical protein